MGLWIGVLVEQLHGHASEHSLMDAWFAPSHGRPIRKRLMEADLPGENTMTDKLEQISSLLHEVSETHHRVFRIVDGADDDWASWYAQWLIDLSELPDLLGCRPVRSELVYVLVGLDKEYTSVDHSEPWEQYYAQRIHRHFLPANAT
jgi:hypothetical protein